MEPKIYVYEIIGETETGFSVLRHGPIIETYEKKRLGVHCLETEREMFKVNRTGTHIVPTLRAMYGEIVLSYDCTFHEGQKLSDEDYVQLTDVYKLNIQEIMGTNYKPQLTECLYNRPQTPLLAYYQLVSLSLFILGMRTLCSCVCL